MNTDDLVWADPAELRTRPPFSTLLPIRREVEETIVHSMREKGEYDFAHPIIVWRSENVVIDGHTRLAAAKKARLDKVSVYFHDFKHDDEALEYAITCQTDRRNLTDQEIASLILAVDGLKLRGRKLELQSSNECVRNLTHSLDDCSSNHRSAMETAAKIGLSSRYKVDQVRALKANDEESLKAVQEGKMTIAQAERSMRAKKGTKAEIAATEVRAYVEENPDFEVRKMAKELGISAGVADGALKLLGLRKKDKREKSMRNGRQCHAGPARPIAAVLDGAVKTSGLPSRRERPAENDRHLTGFALRQIVQNYRLDDDVSLYRAMESLLPQIRAAMERSTNQRSTETMGPYYRMVHALLAVPEPGAWLACDACTGLGFRDGTCRKCNGCGYSI